MVPFLKTTSKLELMLKQKILTGIFILCTIVSIAQPKTYSVKSKKAIKLLEEGQRNYESRNAEVALEFAMKALKKEPEFIEAHILKAYVYMGQRKVNEAILSLESAIRINPSFFPQLKLDLGDLYFKVQRYQDARAILYDYAKNNHPKPRQLSKAKFLIASAEFSIKSIANPVEFKPENLGPNINSEFKDYLPVLSVDQGTLIFTRTIPGALDPKGQEDFYAAFQENGKWGKAFNIGRPINTEMNEGGHTLTPDGQAMIFTICDLYGDYGRGRNGYGSCDLFVSMLDGGRWTNPKNLGPNINSNLHDAQPSMSSDGRTVYFSSTRRGGYGENDIYYSTLTSRGWSIPVNLGDKINTKGREEGVSIHPDNQTLYFTSNGHVGLGRSDVYMSRRQPDGSWGEAINLGYPINTGEDEFDFAVDAKGDYAYITSDREGGYGDWDIYKFKMPEILKPTPVTYMVGRTFDKETKQRLSANFELIDLATEEKTVQSQSNKDGEFLVCLPTGKDYALNVALEGYLFYSENFRLKKTKSLEPTNKDVPLQPIKIGSTVVLKNIFFDVDRFELKSESKVELKKLAEFLSKNPTLKIEIGGHTDNKGSRVHNQTLSENRAKSVKDWLVSNGIKIERLSSKGYADSEPIMDNSTVEGRSANRRTEFKIVGK